MEVRSGASGEAFWHLQARRKCGETQRRENSGGEAGVTQRSRHYVSLNDN